MATLGSPAPPTPPRRRIRSWARRIERCCCLGLTYFPLAFVYSLTTWGLWVVLRLGALPREGRAAWAGRTTSTLTICLFFLLNISYTVAVFTDPGSTLSSKNGYSHLPTHDTQSQITSLTVKSTGAVRFCKKCQARKPDRAHHCSTCKRCVLKMDHHCPWLATCVGLRNAKAFLLFLIYTTLYCYTCCAMASAWVWKEMFSEEAYADSLMPINYVMLVVIAGVIGLVLTGFTGWHISLAWRGMTTIECLEKTRYFSSVRRTFHQPQHPSDNYHQHFLGHSQTDSGGGIQSYGQQLREIHTNALPGITRPEEGEERASPAAVSLHQNYQDLEAARERDRYEAYLDEQDSERLPHAFDLGWRRNLQYLFGDSPWLWWLPVCNSRWNGWTWDVSPKWVERREEIRREREQTRQYNFNTVEEQSSYTNADDFTPSSHTPNDSQRSSDNERSYLSTTLGVRSVPAAGHRSPGKADQILGRDHLASAVPMQPLQDRRQYIPKGLGLVLPTDEDLDLYETSSDEPAD